MSYSCTDFADTILDALRVRVPESAYDDPSKQADLALAVIDKAVGFTRAERNTIVFAFDLALQSIGENLDEYSRDRDMQIEVRAWSKQGKRIGELRRRLVAT